MSETKGRCRSEFESYYADKQVNLNQSEWILADAIDRIAADVAAVKEATLPQTTEERDCAIRERDEARAEVERLRAELAARPAAGWLTKDERKMLLYFRNILLSSGNAPYYPEVKELFGDLERLDAILDRAGSPPVVEVPALSKRDVPMQNEAMAYRDALDRAGVAWREVPRE